jgi:apolipoprotein N-acyltransferase
LVFAPAICYESIYGATCAEFVNKGAEVITIITNDDWWGDTPGYKQHFDFARLRAIENRRYVARSANTGFSGFISPTGDVIAKSNYKEQTALQQEIHKISEKTFYTKYGDFLGRSLAFIAVLLVVFGFVKMIRNKIKVKTSK